MLEYRNTHAGETCLLVGNGGNLHLTPPAWFDYPAFGMNTIHKYTGWIPNFYTAVDNRVMREFGNEIAAKFTDVPKFIPAGLKDWQGDNFIIFNHLAKDLKDGWNPDTLKDGITYHSCMHVAMQLAYWMGFTTLLMIGVEHKPEDGRRHFWGEDEGMPHKLPMSDWFTGYEVLVKGMKERGVKVLNISAETYAPAEILPRADWREYVKKS